jgi:DNA end-binding protein Ku
MPKAIVTAVLTFGLVSIPIKLYTSAMENKVSFNMLTPTGGRVKQQLVDAASGQVVERDQVRKGYEVAKDQFVSFTQEEIEALESGSEKEVVIKEFVEASSVSAVSVSKSYYLGPDKGGDRGYVLLSETMRAMGKVAVATWSNRGHDKLILIQPHGKGLILHEMFYADEVRPFEEIEVAALTISDAERDLAAKLVTSLTTGAYNPAPYEDGFRKRVLEAVERKANGLGPIESKAVKSETQVVSLLDALRTSIAATLPKNPPPPPPKEPKGKAKKP